MNRRFLAAFASAFVVVGLIGAQLGHAQQLPKSDPPDSPPALPKEAPKEEPLFPDDEKDKPQSKPKPDEKPVKPGDAPSDPSAPRDDEVVPVQTPGDGGNPLGPAKDPAGGAPSNIPPAGDPPILPADRLPLGASTGSLTVDVQAPATANVNREQKFKILVKNSGSTPVMGVMVRDPLPDGLEFVKSDPPCAVTGNILSWHLESLAAGAERVMIVTAIPRKPGAFDHAPTVSLRMGSKARTIVKQPLLKVEIHQSEAGSILKGQPVNFQVRVTNTGTGPAKGVVLHADLTPGLKHEQGSSLVVVFKDYLGKDTLAVGETEAIDLEVEAFAGGVAECKVWAESPDVEPLKEARDSLKVTIVEPKLELHLKGPQEKSTESTAAYTLEVSNTGTATARNVVAAAFFPQIGGQLISDYTPSEARWGAKDKKLWWGVGDLEPGGKKEMKFNVQLKGPGTFKIDAASQADHYPRQNDSVTTHVIGMADVRCVLSARTTQLEKDEETIYEVRLSNVGTVEARDVLVTAALTPNLTIVDTTGTQEKAKSSTEKDPHDATFPALNIPPRGSQVLTLLVKATDVGAAKCTVKVAHGKNSHESTTSTEVVAPR